MYIGVFHSWWHACSVWAACMRPTGIMRRQAGSMARAVCFCCPQDLAKKHSIPMQSNVSYHECRVSGTRRTW